MGAPRVPGFTTAGEAVGRVAEAVRAGECERCGETDFSPNVEAFEVSDEIVCDDCADEVIADHGQFGVGA